jgi:hypothetical protein
MLKIPEETGRNRSYDFTSQKDSRHDSRFSYSFHYEVRGLSTKPLGRQKRHSGAGEAPRRGRGGPIRAAKREPPVVTARRRRNKTWQPRGEALPRSPPFRLCAFRERGSRRSRARLREQRKTVERSLEPKEVCVSFSKNSSTTDDPSLSSFIMTMIINHLRRSSGGTIRHLLHHQECKGSLVAASSVQSSALPGVADRTMRDLPLPAGSPRARGSGPPASRPSHRRGRRSQCTSSHHSLPAQRTGRGPSSSGRECRNGEERRGGLRPGRRPAARQT